jgi:hypothetical protein
MIVEEVMKLVGDNDDDVAVAIVVGGATATIAAASAATAFPLLPCCGTTFELLLLLW